MCNMQGQLLQFLRMLKEQGKKLFLMTNSPYYFVDGGMRFMLEVICVILHLVNLPFPFTYYRRSVSLHVLTDQLDGVPFFYLHLYERSIEKSFMKCSLKPFNFWIRNPWASKTRGGSFLMLWLQKPTNLTSTRLSIHSGSFPLHSSSYYSSLFTYQTDIVLLYYVMEVCLNN